MISFICLFGVWKEFQTNISQMVVCLMVIFIPWDRIREKSPTKTPLNRGLWLLQDASHGGEHTFHHLGAGSLKHMDPGWLDWCREKRTYPGYYLWYSRKPQFLGSLVASRVCQLAGAQPPTNCSFARHLGKIAILLLICSSLSTSQVSISGFQW